ncbi:hypothetical protein PL11201_310017 [Planktothrix sp. PCC 11201]|nr:hypothetical protein PL11201_1030001 [Planktothrix sp. PCC 11201]SKB12242.1 hypothetical protein PL11201_310017 [Planktothrix sp. PCC 11201]
MTLKEGQSWNQWYGYPKLKKIR